MEITLKQLSKILRDAGDPRQANEIDMALRLLAETQRKAIEKAIILYVVSCCESQQSGLGDK